MTRATAILHHLDDARRLDEDAEHWRSIRRITVKHMVPLVDGVIADRVAHAAGHRRVAGLLLVAPPGFRLALPAHAEVAA